MKHRKRSKLFFPFGLITLSLLPLLGFQKIASLYKTRTAPQHCIELNVSKSGEDFSENKIGEKRRYEFFALSGDTIANHLILNRARQRLNRIKRSGDKVNGIYILISDATKYKDFIKMINYGDEEFPRVFSVYRNDFWAMYIHFDTTAFPQAAGKAFRKISEGFEN